MSGKWMLMKCLRLRTFLPKPSKFQVMVRKEVVVGDIDSEDVEALLLEGEGEEEASTARIELSELRCLTEERRLVHQGKILQ